MNDHKGASNRGDSSKGLPSALSQMNLNAAGIDVGAESHFVAVPAERDEQWVRDNVSRKGVRLLETYDWADLILTAEAIRTKFWKVLQRRGLEHMDEFLETHPEVKERYAEAIWDSHTSLFAKQKRMTHTELIRMRLEARINAEVAQRLSEELIKQP